MRLVAVNVARPRIALLAGQPRKTAIFKQAVVGPVEVQVEGLAGDAVANRDDHGGPDQAIYLYSTDDYAWWAAQLGRELVPAAFGENLTVDGVESGGLLVGDRLRVGGGVLLEVTAPRIPCSTLSGRLEEPRFVRWFANAGRPGAYLRVLAPGSVEASLPVELDRSAASSVSLLQLVRLLYDRSAAPADLERALEAPIAERLRDLLERRLGHVGS